MPRRERDALIALPPPVRAIADPLAVSWSKLRVRSPWLIVIPFFWFARPNPGLLAVGGALALGGLWIRGWAAGTIHKNRELTTSGPYAWTRNPLYLGSFLIGLGGVAISGGHWIWPLVFVVFFAAIYRRTIGIETRNLSALFPEEYARYADAVPVFLPRLTPWREGAGASAREGFGWPQYRYNREWEAALGVLATFLVLAAKVTLL